MLGQLSVTSEDERRAWRWIGGSAVTFALAALLLPLAGPAPLDVSRVWAREAPDWAIFVQLRLSRTLLGLFAGAALALGGSLFQSMLRNALATPYTLGVSTGASLGAVIAIAFDWHLTAGIAGIWAGALAGAAVVLVLVVGAATRERDVSALGLLLAGVATNSVCSALILLVYSLSSMSHSFAIARWLIGSLDAVDYPPLGAFVLVVTLTAAFVMRRARQWNLLAVDEKWAGTRGTDVRRLLSFGYVAGSVLAAVTVAFTGPIGFVGLVVPHMLRGLLGQDNRLLVPTALVGGGIFLLAADTLARNVVAPAELSVGVITSFCGAPFFVYLLRTRATLAEP